VYDIVAGDVDATSNGTSKNSIFSHLPLSDGECQVGWDELMAFEADGGSFQPSPNALAQVWTSINAAALAEGIKLQAQFLTNDIIQAAAEEGHPPGLVEAVLEYLSTEDNGKDGPWSCLDRKKTVVFTGRTLLEAKRGADFLIADFTDMWEDRLPEVWRKDAQLSAIEGMYDFPSDTTIRVRSKAAAPSVGDSSVAAMKPSARKWHEKFAKTRNK
jgi:sister chromatid cohesion protein DCC1